MVEEVIIIVKEASDVPFTEKEYGVATLAELGYSPYNRAVLDHSDVLETASPEIKSQRTQVLIMRNDKSSTKSFLLSS